MIHLSSYHSNGLPTVVWSNKVNLIGEKVYKPKIHFCEYCKKPILIYGRLIPCKHVFCFTCATLCLTQPSSNGNRTNSAAPPTPTMPGPSEPNQSSSHKDNNSVTMMFGDESTSNTTPTTIHQENTDSPIAGLNGSNKPQQVVRGCHRCGGKALRVEKNLLNSVFVCQVDTCRRTYLSARDLQAHVTHRHSRNKSSNNAGQSSASMAAISSSPYISSSTVMHLSHQNQSNNNHRQSSSNNVTSNNNHQNHHHHKQSRDSHRHYNGVRDRDRERDRERDRYNRDRDSYQRERERERDSKEYHRQSIQRAAQWAEASAQMLEKGLTR